MENFERLSSPLNVSMDNEWFDVNAPSHFWMVARLNEVLDYLPRNLTSQMNLLEIGCGNGIFRTQVENKINIAVDACDPNLGALSHASKGKGRLMLYNIFDKNPSLIKKYNVVFLMDVIEHIEDDINFLKIASEYLKDGGEIIINVPYGPWFYSLYDKGDGHYRRYTKAQLIKVLHAAGFEIKKIKCWGLVLVPIVIVRKFLLPLITDEKNAVKEGFKLSSPLINNIFKLALKIESYFSPIRIIGSSAMVIAKKRSS